MSDITASPEFEAPSVPLHPAQRPAARTRCSSRSWRCLLLYFVGAEEGATSVFPGMTLHEWVHDARHLLGFPCH